jgi:drug/metabolite transporter (DMT)-like permease
MLVTGKMRVRRVSQNSPSHAFRAVWLTSAQRKMRIIPFAEGNLAFALETEIKFAKKGLGWGVFSGAVWGMDGVLLGMALVMAPFVGGASLIVAPLVGAALHDGIAAAVLLAYNLQAGKIREIGRTIASRPGRIVILSALAGGPIGMAGYLLGIAHAGAAYAMSISAIYPAVGAVLAVIILKEKISFRVWIGIAACIAGAIIIGYTPPDAARYPHFHLGLAFATLAALGWGIESVLSTYGMDLVDPDIAINIRELTSFLAYAIIVIPVLRGFPIMWSALHSGSIKFIACAGVCGAVSYLAWYKALNMTGVGRAMALSITYALWAIVFSALLTGLKITPSLVVGAAVIFAGAALIVSNPRELISLRWATAAK